MTVTRAIDASTVTGQPMIRNALSPTDDEVVPTQNPILGQGALAINTLLSAAGWATAQWGDISLGDRRLDRRAVQVGTAMTQNPDQSLPRQMNGDRAALEGAYGLINHPGVSLDRLSRPHWEQTRQEAREQRVVLFVQDTTQLDYTHFSTMEGLGPIGDGNGRGLLLHSTLGVVPSPTPHILGLAHQQVVLRRSADETPSRHTPSPEGQVWASAAEAVGSPPEDVLWVHVGDRGSDDFRFMDACRDKHFLIRVMRNRLLAWDQEEVDLKKRKIKDFARSLPVQHRYTLDVPASHDRPARIAQMCLAWAPVTVPAPRGAPPDLRHQPPIRAWLIRAWEANAPSDQEPIEWILITSVPAGTLAQAKERVWWYTHRWLSEEYHQGLKTGCKIEHRQFDHGDDIRRLLGFCGPIAVRLLQLRQAARLEPQAPVAEHVDPLTVRLLTERLEWDRDEVLTVRAFWRAVSHLGGYLGRPGDGPPGWKTFWKGWRELSELVRGARLYANLLAKHAGQGENRDGSGANANDEFH